MGKIEIDSEHLQQLLTRLMRIVKDLDADLLAHRMALETLYAGGLDQAEVLSLISTARENPSTQLAIEAKYREMETKLLAASS
jgi:hypothetical protein